MEKRGKTDQIYLLIILQKQMKQKQYARMKGRKQTKRDKFKWQPRRTEEKKTHRMLQEAPFSNKKKDRNIHTKNTHSPPACYSVVDPH